MNFLDILPKYFYGSVDRDSPGRFSKFHPVESAATGLVSVAGGLSSCVGCRVRRGWFCVRQRQPVVGGTWVQYHRGVCRSSSVDTETRWSDNACSVVVRPQQGRHRGTTCLHGLWPPSSSGCACWRMSSELWLTWLSSLADWVTSVSAHMHTRSINDCPKQ